MKKHLIALLAAASLAAAAHAAVIVGTDVGYLIDSEEEYLTARAGFEVAKSDAFSHQLELEIGYTEDKEGGIKADILPVTANYRFVANSTGKWGYYGGLGVGFARSRIDGASIFGPVKLRDNSFAAQAFVGASYRATDAVALNFGAKYLWIDDVNFAGSKVEVGDDFAISAGVSIKF